MRLATFTTKDVTRGPAIRKDGEVVGPGELKTVHERAEVFPVLDRLDALTIARVVKAWREAIEEASLEVLTDFYLSEVGTLTPDEGALTDPEFQLKLDMFRPVRVAAMLSARQAKLDEIAGRYKLPWLSVSFGKDHGRPGVMSVQFPVEPRGERFETFAFRDDEV